MKLTKKEKRELWRKLSQFLKDNEIEILSYEMALAFKDESGVRVDGNLPGTMPSELLGE